MALLDSSEKEIMKLRFLEHWEYHEIAAAKSIPIGTVQWKVLHRQKEAGATFDSAQGPSATSGLNPCGARSVHQTAASLHCGTPGAPLSE